VNLAGALAPFNPYSGLVYLDSTVAVNLYTDSISQQFGSLISASIDPAFSTSPIGAVMVTDMSGAWAVSPVNPGISQFTLTFDGLSAPVSTYDTGPWRVTAIKPFTARIGVGETVTFTPLLLGSVSWSVTDPTVASIITNGNDTGTLTGLSEGNTRVSLTVDGQVVDYSGQILVVPSVTSSSGGGGCGTTLPPGDDPWTGLVELTLAGILLLGFRRRYMAEASSTFNVQRSK
jgi:hypothetical protein